MTTTESRPADTAPDAASTLDVRPTAGYIGAEIHGVDLSKPLDPVTVAEIRSTLLQWKVVFFRDQELTQQQHLDFAAQFGTPTPAHPTLPAVFPDFPQILLLDNKAFGSDAGGGKKGGPAVDSQWHTDVTFIPNPPMGSILRGVVVPPYGGDTQWVNLAVAYERLSEPLQAMLDGLHAVHHNVLPIKRGDLPPKLIKQFLGNGLRAVHPVVRVHPETGEKVLFVNPNFTSHIVELSRQESRHLLAMLYEHMTDGEFSTRFRWQPGSIAFWDNRATAHLVPTDIPAGMHRSMQRITIAGDLSVGPDGTTSYALEGDAFG
jgi:taurine dioxygenase